MPLPAMYRECIDRNKGLLTVRSTPTPESMSLRADPRVRMVQYYSKYTYFAQWLAVEGDGANYGAEVWIACSPRRAGGADK